MKNVLTIPPYHFLPASSGGQRAVFLLYKHLADNVHLTCASTSDNRWPEDQTPAFTLLPVFSSSRFRYINPVNFFKLKKIIRENHIDTLIWEHPYMGVFAWLLKKSCHKKMIIRSHNIEGLRFKELGKGWWKLLWYYERWVHRQADFSFFITREDQIYAEKHYGLSPGKSAVITYGIERQQIITQTEKKEITRSFKKEHGIAPSKTLLLFNGIFGYKPNDEALRLLTNQILPALIKMDPEVCLVICGKNIPADLTAVVSDNCLILGFVPDIERVFKAAEIFLNPIWLGGGIKTKLVEALASGCAAVSFESGAIGIPLDLLAGKISLTSNLLVQPFVEAVIRQKQQLHIPTPQEFYDYFSWDKIAAAAAGSC